MTRTQPDTTEATRLDVIERRLDALERHQQRPLRADDVQLVDVLRQRVGAGVTFGAAELFAHAAVDPDVHRALVAAGLTSVSAVGRRLSRLARRGCLERVGRGVSGAMWCVSQLRVTDT